VSTFIRSAVVAFQICEITRNSHANLYQFKVIQGHRPWCLSIFGRRLSPVVFEILTRKARKWLVCLILPLRGTR